MSWVFQMEKDVEIAKSIVTTSLMLMRLQFLLYAINNWHFENKLPDWGKRKGHEVRYNSFSVII